ncbi:hypothetical protein PsorP6_000303 [Peronosclerospora sorghi]|uniref:Uncharacterized protein n=1 Tax=Peronosclerospora sorghi TaxID=230839 RepID=A0ACC0WRS5_9STRA|nr:hypothetical protein PsorP6_000303 [Peronosclerospora sorghi]
MRRLRLQAYIQLGEWQISLTEPYKQADGDFDHVRECLETATKLDPTNHRAWHEWALMNFRALEISVKDSSLGDPKQYAGRSIQVASKALNPTRKLAAERILAAVRRQIFQLVYEADMVSRELICVAIFWNELWHVALEEVSKHFFNNRDVAAMIADLAPLHEQMD